MSATNPGVSPDPGELLDERSEFLMDEMIYHAQKGRVGTADASRTALRARIRELVEEARREGEESVYKTAGNLVRPR